MKTAQAFCWIVVSLRIVGCTSTNSGSNTSAQLKSQTKRTEVHKSSDNQEQKVSAIQVPKAKLKSSELDTFIDVLKLAGIDNSIVSRVSQNGDSLTVIVANAWHYQPYQVRLQAAQNLWELWARITSPNDPDKARLEITDFNGNSVGGSRWLAGSQIIRDVY